MMIFFSLFWCQGLPLRIAIHSQVFVLSAQRHYSIIYCSARLYKYLVLVLMKVNSSHVQLFIVFSLFQVHIDLGLVQYFPLPEMQRMCAKNNTIFRYLCDWFCQITAS